MDINIEQIPSYRIAYLRNTGPYGVQNLKTMEDLKCWAKSHDLLSDTAVILGIAQDDPATTPPEVCRYDTCIVITDDYSINDTQVFDGNITGGQYAVFSVEHTAEAVQRAWARVFKELDIRGLQLDASRPVLERYKVEMVKAHRCEICVPIYERFQNAFLFNNAHTQSVLSDNTLFLL